MKICPKCGSQAEDNATFCTTCGTQFAAQQPQPQQTYQAQPQQAYYAPAPVYNPYDRTSQFEAKDIADNKLFALLAYLLGPIGVIVVLLMGGKSPFASYHVRQSIRYTVVELLSALVGGVLSIVVSPFLFFDVPEVIYFPIIVYAILALVTLVLKIITIIQVMCGKAVDAPILRSIGFLK